MEFLSDSISYDASFGLPDSHLFFDFPPANRKTFSMDVCSTPLSNRFSVAIPISTHRWLAQWSV
jgi:hypothetical protein